MSEGAGLEINTGDDILNAGNQARIAIMEDSPKPENAPPFFREAVGKVAGAWFDPKSFEEDPMLYEKLGVRTFKKYMPTSGDLVYRHVWKRFGAGNFTGDGSERALRRYESFTRLFEGIHLSFLAIGVATITEELQAGRIDRAAFAAGLNTLVNVYPIMVQRYNRSRLYKAINKANKLEAKESPNQNL